MLSTKNELGILPFTPKSLDREKAGEIFEGVPANLEVTSTGKLVITNTGGSSASEGGMGSGSADDTEKGSLGAPGEKSGSATANDDSDDTFDPLKKSIKEADKANEKE